MAMLSVALIVLSVALSTVTTMTTMSLAVLPILRTRIRIKYFSDVVHDAQQGSVSAKSDFFFHNLVEKREDVFAMARLRELPDATRHLCFVKVVPVVPFIV
ncbi:hypothetical protein EDD37DRAFT_629291 [Exophiala viscosa]|uniref:uncharacterized protein n=1 Tax=Exophiala viscosa TaxID=2486360 RepID=UPI0021919CA3|nr:hypothetical protein EDD37DRAFT_629291 [Exophiala viscosa]